MKKNENEQGQLTVEASLIFSLYILFIFTMFSIIKLITSQLIIQNVINEACLEVSQYTYLAEKIKQEDILKEFDIDLKTNEIIEIFKDTVIDESEQEIYRNILIKEMVKKHLPNDEDDYLKKLGVINGLGGIDFSNSKIDSRSSNISIIYDIKLPISIVNKKFTIIQNARVNNFGRIVTEDNEILEDSIWKKSPTVRGKIFISRYRDKYKEKALKVGQVVDFYDIYGNELIQVNSINLYSNSYTDFSEDGYSFKYDGVYKLVKRYSNQLIKKSDLKELEMMDGRMIKVSNPNKKLVLILPLEAKEFNEDLTRLKNEISSLGVNVEYIFEEKAL